MKIKLFLFIILLSIFLEKLSGATEPIFTKTTPTFEVTMTLTEDSVANKTIWKIFLEKENKKILLDQYGIDAFYTKDTQLRFVGDMKKYIIIGDVLRVQNTIYIMIYKFNQICLLEYNLTEERFEKKEYILGKEIGRSYINYGNPKFSSEMKKISSDEIWLTWDYYHLAKIDLFKNMVYYIEFEDDIKPLDRNGMVVIKQDSEALSESIPGTLPFELEQNSELLCRELKKVLNDSIKGTFVYVGFLDDMITTLDMIAQKEDDEEEYDDDEYGDDEPVPVKRSGGVTYFFYKDSASSLTHVIKYNHNDKAWKIGKYKEIEIKAQ